MPDLPVITWVLLGVMGFSALVGWAEDRYRERSARPRQQDDEPKHAK